MKHVSVSVGGLQSASWWINTKGGFMSERYQENTHSSDSFHSNSETHSHAHILRCSLSSCPQLVGPGNMKKTKKQKNNAKCE